MPRVKIVWSPAAISHFSSWIHYIAKDSVKTAEKERQKILKGVGRLETFPQSGRVVPEFSDPTFREVIVKPIRIMYRLKGDEVRILTFHHAKRNLDASLFV